MHRLFGVGALLVALVAPLAAPAVVPDAEPLPSRIIVRFTDGLSSEEQTRVLERHGAAPVHLVPELDLVVADVAGDPSRTLVGLFDEPSVVTADPDRTRAATGTFDDGDHDARWALRRIDAHAVDPSGAATIAVLDTGVDAAESSLFGRVLVGWSALGRSGDAADLNGHGTALAAIASANSGAGVAAEDVFILPIQVLDAAGVGHDSDIVRGIVRAVDRGADVILMGFAGEGYSGALQAAIDYAWAEGTVLVAPVGDERRAAPLFPAASPRVIGVGATTGIDAPWDGSNRGPAVLLAAPGLEVPTFGGRTLTGTAAAAALVAGGAAVLAASDGRASNATIVGRLARSAEPVAPRVDVGNGRIDLGRALADRSTDGIVPSGVLDGVGGPFVTTFTEATTPLAGWALERAAHFVAPLRPIALDPASTPVLSSTGGAPAPAMAIWTWSLAADPLRGGAVLRQRSFLVGSTLDDALASDHGAFTYGSVSPPALEYGVLS